MEQQIIGIYRFIFCRRFFYRFNYHVYKMALRGMGIFNAEGNRVTGESFLFDYLKKHVTLKIIFDVGANIGEYAQEIKANFPNAKVYAFEPHPKTFSRLKKVAKKNHIMAYNYAVGKSSTQVKLWDFADDADLKHTQPTSALASIHREVIESFHKQKAQSYTVKQLTLDSFMKKNNINEIDFLKIDTEGNEYDVLVGAKDAIKSNKIHIIQFEFNEMNAYSKRFLKDFIDLLSGYNFYRLMPKGMLPLGAYRPITHEIFGFQNIVAVSKKYNKYFDGL